MPSAPSPPAIPPDFPGLTQPLFNFPIFDHDRTRGRNTRLPVAVTSTLLANPESDDLVLQLLGDAQSYAASGTNQLPVNEGQRQQVQSALAQQRIQHLAASAQERLRVQNPSFPQSASQNLARPHYNSESSQHDRQTLQRLADMLQPPTHTIETIEHYEPQGSGRPSRTAAQQSHSYQPPSHNWVHRQVLPRQTDLRPGLTRLTPHPHPHSPVHSLNTNRQLDVNVDMPWMDLNTWGRLPADIEQKHQQQQQEQQRQQQQHRSSANAHFDASMPDPRSTFSNFAALHSKHELVSRHSTGGIGLGQDSRHYPQSTGTVSEHSASDAAAACCSHPSDTAFGYHARPSLFDAPHSFFQAPGPTPADVLNFPEPFAAVDSGNDAVQTFPHRWRQELQSQGSQGLPQQQSRQNPFPSWANQVHCCL